MRTAPLFLSLVFVLAACSPGDPDDVGGSLSSSADMMSSARMSASMELDTAYADDQGQFTVRYPAHWRVQTANTISTASGELVGTAFVLPTTEHAGTQLLDARVHVATVSECPALDGEQTVTLNGRIFRKGRWANAGAGNRYSGVVYTTESDGNCTVVTLFEHWCNLGADCGSDRSGEFSGEEMLERIVADMAASLSFATTQTGSTICTLDAKICPDGTAVGRSGPDCEFDPCPGE